MELSYKFTFSLEKNDLIKNKPAGRGIDLVCELHAPSLWAPGKTESLCHKTLQLVVSLLEFRRFSDDLQLMREDWTVTIFFSQT